MDSEFTIKILTAVPVYNNAGTVRGVVERALSAGARVLVIDDGSTDGSLDRLAGLAVERLRFETNRGKGVALRAALDFAAERGFSHLVTLDADGQHDPAELPKFAAAIAAHPNALIVGERAMEEGGAPPSSIFGRKFSNFWFHVQTGKRVADAQSGYRAYPVALMRRLRLRGRRFEFETEVLVKSAWAGLEVMTIPISVRYAPPGERVSHFHRFWDNARISWLNTRLCARRLLPIPHRKLVESPTLHQIMMGHLLHPVRTVKTVLTENLTPIGLAMAAAMGVVVGATPLFGAHSLLIVYVAARFNLNKPMALATQNVVMPPFGPVACIEMGYYMLRGQWLITDFSRAECERLFLHEAHYRLFEWALGWVVVGPVVGAVTGLVVYLTARAANSKQWTMEGKARRMKTTQ